MSKGFTSSYRIVLLAGGLGACFAALGVRLVWLHAIGREDLLSQVAEVRHQIIEDKGRRGDIRDANGVRLATSVPIIKLGVDRASFTPKDAAKLPQLAALLGMPEIELQKIFTAKFRVRSAKTPAPVAASAPAAPAGLALNIPNAAGAPEAAAEPAEDLEASWVRLKEITEQTNIEVRKLGLRCLTYERIYRRDYPSGQLASHVIGYVNKQEEAVAGIESYLDFYLSGQDGWRVGEVDGRRRELAQFQTRRIDPSNGYDVFLSIQSSVQDIVEQELQYIAQKYQPSKATIIVSDPRTGFILGMGNYPTFNPNEYNKVPKEEMARMKNVAVADVYEPGSVFKIVAVSAGLEEKVIQTNSTFDVSSEKVVYRGNTLKLPAEDHNYKTPTVVPLAQVVSYSSNRGAAQIGMLLGEDRLTDYIHRFGFDRKLGFPGREEVRGILDPVAKWSRLEITRIPMGHAVAATALQMHQAMSAIANGGMLMRPQIIREIRDAAGDRKFFYEAAPLNRVVSPETARTVAEMLTAVASRFGTAVAAEIEGFDVAGKTGTTQKIIDGRYSEKHHVVSFVGFFPANAGPKERQVAISVIIDDADARAPNGIAYGGAVAAPSFRNIGLKLIPILDIKAPGQPTVPGLVATTGGRP